MGAALDRGSSLREVKIAWYQWNWAFAIAVDGKPSLRRLEGLAAEFEPRGIAITWANCAESAREDKWEDFTIDAFGESDELDGFMSGVDDS